MTTYEICLIILLLFSLNQCLFSLKLHCLLQIFHAPLGHQVQLDTVQISGIVVEQNKSILQIFPSDHPEIICACIDDDMSYDWSHMRL